MGQFCIVSGDFNSGKIFYSSHVPVCQVVIFFNPEPQVCVGGILFCKHLCILPCEEDFQEEKKNVFYPNQCKICVMQINMLVHKSKLGNTFDVLYTRGFLTCIYVHYWQTV